MFSPNGLDSFKPRWGGLDGFLSQGSCSFVSPSLPFSPLLSPCLPSYVTTCVPPYVLPFKDALSCLVSTYLVSHTRQQKSKGIKEKPPGRVRVARKNTCLQEAKSKTPAPISTTASKEVETGANCLGRCLRWSSLDSTLSPLDSACLPLSSLVSPCLFSPLWLCLALSRFVCPGRAFTLNERRNWAHVFAAEKKANKEQEILK